jgi:hypothetical protein
MVNTLHRSVREAFRAGLRGGTQRSAFEASVSLLKQHRPQWLEPDIRRAVARMIAEEPSTQPPTLQ